MIADPAAIDDLAIDVQIENVRQTQLRAGGVPASDALVRALPRIRAPVATFWGERDAFFRSDAAERRRLLHAAHPDASIRMIPGAGHWTTYEAADVVNAALAALWKNNPCLGVGTARSPSSVAGAARLRRFVPLRHNAARRHHIPKANWPA
jgi:pimeloyl-ACP methyl ester carboxylesterase